MGISNLLVLLRPLTHKVHISKYKGHSVGIDAMCWLHRGAIACATELLVAEKANHKFIQFIMKMLHLLAKQNIKPILVFDGRKLPLKADEDEFRRTQREAAKKKAHTMLMSGMSTSNPKFRSMAARAIHVTGDMIKSLIMVLQKSNIQYIIAPYEADAQLAFLCRINIIKTVVTEDSDLLAYKCPRVFFKIDANGDGQEIELDQYLDTTPKLNGSNPSTFTSAASFHDIVTKQTNSLESSDIDPFLDSDSENIESISHAVPMEKQSLSVALKEMPWSTFVTMCVLTGCDYTKTAHISGLGIRMAFDLSKEYHTVDRVFDHILRDPKLSKRFSKYLSIDPGDTENISEVIEVNEALISEIKRNKNKQTWRECLISHILAAVVFSHHPVYDPRIHRIVPICAADDTTERILKRSFEDSIQYSKYRIPVGVLTEDFAMSPEELSNYINGHTLLDRIPPNLPKDSCNAKENLVELAQDNIGEIPQSHKRFQPVQAKTHKLRKKPFSRLDNVPSYITSQNKRLAKNIPDTKKYTSESKNCPEDQENLEPSKKEMNKFISSQMSNITRKMKKVQPRQASLNEVFNSGCRISVSTPDQQLPQKIIPSSSSILDLEDFVASSDDELNSVDFRETITSKEPQFQPSWKEIFK